MEITCQQSALKTALGFVGKAIPNRPTHPILANLKLSFADNKLTVTGFDLSLGIQASIDAIAERDGEITLPAKLFSDIINKIPSGDIVIDFEEPEDEYENPIVDIKSAVGRFQVRGVSTDEYPELPVIDSEKVINLPISVLSEGLRSAIFSASTDDTKQILTGVRLVKQLDTLELASTDGHRLSVVKVQCDSGEDFALTIPAIALKELSGMLLNKEGFINLFFDGSLIKFQVDNYSLSSRLLDGSYPNYQQLIPTNFSRTMVVNRKQVIDSLERVSVLATDKNNMVKFSLVNEQLTVSIQAKELGNAKESFNVEMSGDSIDIGFNIKYLLEGLKAINSQEITFNMNEPTQPVIITPLGGLKMTYLLMPVQLKD